MLPNTDPSLPSNQAPLFQDNSFVRGDQMRANNQSIWGNLEYLETSKALLGGSASQNFAALKFTGSSTTDATSATDTAAGFSTAGGGAFAKKLYVGTEFHITGSTDSSGAGTGSFQNSGGGYFAKKLYVGSDLNVTGNGVFFGDLSFDRNLYFLNAANEIGSSILYNRIANNSVEILTNTYYSAGFKFRESGYSMFQYFDNTNGLISFYGSNSGLADAAITYTELFRINNALVTSIKPFSVSDTTASTSTTTGSGVFAGGLGVAGDEYLGGSLFCSGTVSGLSISSGSSGFSMPVGARFLNYVQYDDTDVSTPSITKTVTSGTYRVMVHGDCNPADYIQIRQGGTTGTIKASFGSDIANVSGGASAIITGTSFSITSVNTPSLLLITWERIA